MGFSLMPGPRDAVGALFLRGLLGLEVGGGRLRGVAPSPGQVVPAAPRRLFPGGQTAGARRPQAPAPAEAPVAAGEPWELRRAAGQRWREGAGGVWVLSPTGPCARGAGAAAPGPACSLCTQKVKGKTTIGRFHPPPPQRPAFQVALMACE